MTRFPVSFAQQRLWFLDQLAPGELTYVVPFAMWLDGPLDTEALQRALDAMVARHSTLRTSIVSFDGVPEQVVADTASVPIEHVTLAPGQGERDAEAVALDRARRPFALDRGPLLRATLVDLGSQRRLFVLVLHHVIVDGLSIDTLFQEMSIVYSGERAGRPADLPAQWMDYGDFALWQQERLRGEELERQLGYWREQLRGAPELLNLPTVHPRPVRQAPHGELATASLDTQTTKRLAELAQGSGATMFMAFLAAFVAVLSRYARQDDIVVGTPVGARTHVELESIVGMFANTVPLRVSVADDPTFTELLARVRDITLDAMAHQELPFSKMVELFAPDRTLAHAPLVQAQFAYHSLTAPVLDLPGVGARGWPVPTGTAKVDVSMAVDNSSPEGTLLTLEYRTDLFDSSWARRFLRGMATVLRHAVATPDTRVADLALLSTVDCDDLLARYGRPIDAALDESPVDIRTWLAASTAQVRDARGVVPMKDVCDRAARLARVLADHGVGAETPVGLCLGRGTDMLVALLGVWWAGGAYVPLDPAFPPARLSTMVTGAQLRLVVTDGEHRELAAAVTADATVIDVADPAVAVAQPLPVTPLPPDALAYIIFTSGSTGRPKGVGIEHRAVANLLGSFRQALRLDASDRFVAVTTLSFDIAVLELLLPPVCGADLVIASGEQTREPDRLRRLIERTAATAMQATPQSWRLLLSAGGVPRSLRLRLCGGEALPRDLADQLDEPGTVLWNLYGPTETTVWSAAGTVASGPVEIGPPIANTRVYVLDDRLMPVPVGVVGDVWIAGRGLARGYHNRPQLTAQAFMPDPIGGAPGARMYRTGDLGRWLDGGGLELIGRTDHQVKVRGFRIECGEIEAVLRAHRDVRQAAVVTAPRGGEPALVAYIVPRRGAATAQPDADLLGVLRPHLAATLPDYMVPDLVVALPALPLTPNAKVDRAALPAPVWGQRAASAERVEPRNPVEASFAQIWAELLATSNPIGVRDNLFELGGHSLTATRFVARVADLYGVNLPVHHVFATPTIAALAEIVAADPAFEAGTAEPDVDLDQLSDEDLDVLLRAALAARERRRAQKSH